ncbi:GIY-YIG nuclease family protein [Romeriopsis navalis]|uniref:GIY-YIG nuclease family protein n=1 Tax=Romeriopsis navalis TaxID=2992132 RepID=UPI0021F8413C|nr:GIY-YIG nuclease family protein [Romeriopsis navalis]
MNPEETKQIEHQDVPAAHQGLHDFLYSADDEHSAAPTIATAVAATTDTPRSLQTWCDDAKNAKIAGVYAVMNADRQTQFISYSRNVALSLKSHLLQHGEEVCAIVTVETFRFPKRAAMEQLRDEWIAALPSPPPGNIDGSWATTIKDASSQAMSDAERAAYEEKKLKLRRAMADGTLNKEILATPTADSQREDLAAAMNEDNWSAVIREQTQETILDKPE